MSDDLLNVNFLLGKLPTKPQVRAVRRLGKVDDSKNRRLKLMFDTSEIPMSLFKNIDFFESEKLKVTNDSTPRERELLRAARDSLQKRTEKSESNLTIRFICGLPTVVRQTPKIV